MPDNANAEMLAATTTFLRNLLLLVPGASTRPPEVRRAEGFLDQVEGQVRGWKETKRGRKIRQQLVVTLPAMGPGRSPRISVDGMIQACRGRGASPNKVWIASPFFDADENASQLTATLCKSMARGQQRKLCFCVPAIQEDDESHMVRLAAPKALLLTPQAYKTSVEIEIVPAVDGDKNPRRWHAKMVWLQASGEYYALMIGSSNFTNAGMGVGRHRNAEANLRTIADYQEYGREVGHLEAVWPDMEPVSDPHSAEWLGLQSGGEDEDQITGPPLPAGFLSATYRAGIERQLVLRFDPTQLPEEWSVHTCGRDGIEVLSVSSWKDHRRPSHVELAWIPIQPPEKLLVRWGDYESFLPLNVQDRRNLPPPVLIDHMSADDLLWILAAADPSAAFRAWAKQQQPSDGFDEDLDSAIPIDLDPLRHYDVQATFLHRVRRRARILAQLRHNLERPVWGRQVLEWRLRGLIGIEALSDRLVRDFTERAAASDEALLRLADFLIVLREVDYQPSDGALPKAEYEKIFRPFLRELANNLRHQVETHRGRVSEDLMHFWERVVEQCQE